MSSSDEVSSAIAMVPSAKIEAANNLDVICTESRRALAQATGDFQKGLILARGMQALREHLTNDMMEDIMLLVGSKLGFRTDRDNGGTPYPVAVVKDVVIEAMLRGCRVTGNEFNVISGNFYLTKEGLERTIADWPGVYNVVHRPGVPVSHGTGGALVDYILEWEVHTYDDAGELLDIRKEKIEALKTNKMDERIAVRVNKGMGTDAILGKARRKMLNRMHDMLTGKRTDVATAGEVVEAIAEAPVVEEAPTTDIDPRSYFAHCEEITQVDQTLTAVKKIDARPEIDEAAQLRRDQIRAGRGEASNEKK